MSKNEKYFEYKGYHTKVEFDYDSLTLFGKIEGIDDLVIFECEDATKIEQEFHDAVDDYLTLCEENGKDPDKEYRGVFNVRIAPELHKSLSTIAYRSSTTLNSVVEAALERFVLSEEVGSTSVTIQMNTDNQYTPKTPFSGETYVTPIISEAK